MASGTQVPLALDLMTTGGGFSFSATNPSARQQHELAVANTLMSLNASKQASSLAWPPALKNEVPISPVSSNGDASSSPLNMGSSHMIGASSMKPVRKPSSSSSSGRVQDELCLVCGDRASGYHYNALACEGCKGFFRRSVTKSSSYRCKYGGSCEIDMYMRRKCQACRLKKCYAVGMRAECVVPESQCARKREAKAAMMRHQNSVSNSAANSPLAASPLSVTPVPTPIPKIPPPRVLLPEEEELINRIVFFQDIFENPSEEELNKVYHVPFTSLSPSSTGSSDECETESDRLFKHIVEMTILTVKLIVEFSKQLPGFNHLCREDQVTVLKGCSSEVMMLRAARKYDPQRDCIIYATNYPFSQDNYVKAGLGNEALFRFCKNMCRMKVDNAEYALITAIVIFSERANLRKPKQVEKIQEIYVDALQSYVMGKRKTDHVVSFAKLLSVLTELRSQGNSNSQQWFELRMVNRRLPPFLAETWDVHYDT